MSVGTTNAAMAGGSIIDATGTEYIPKLAVTSVSIDRNILRTTANQLPTLTRGGADDQTKQRIIVDSNAIYFCDGNYVYRVDRSTLVKTASVDLGDVVKCIFHHGGYVYACLTSNSATGRIKKLSKSGFGNVIASSPAWSTSVQIHAACTDGTYVFLVVYEQSGAVYRLKKITLSTLADTSLVIAFNGSTNTKLIFSPPDNILFQTNGVSDLFRYNISTNTWFSGEITLASGNQQLYTMGTSGIYFYYTTGNITYRPYTWTAGAHKSLAVGNVNNLLDISADSFLVATTLIYIDATGTSQAGARFTVCGNPYTNYDSLVYNISKQNTLYFGGASVEIIRDPQYPSAARYIGIDVASRQLHAYELYYDVVGLVPA